MARMMPGQFVDGRIAFLKAELKITRLRPFLQHHARTTDSPLEGDGFEPSVPRVMDGDLGRQVPALIAVFELAGTAVALQRGTKVVWPHRHPEFP
jgi:hypothetical protein